MRSYPIGAATRACHASTRRCPAAAYLSNSPVRQPSSSGRGNFGSPSSTQPPSFTANITRFSSKGTALAHSSGGFLDHELFKFACFSAD